MNLFALSAGFTLEAQGDKGVPDAAITLFTKPGHLKVLSLGY